MGGAHNPNKCPGRKVMAYLSLQQDPSVLKRVLCINPKDLVAYIHKHGAERTK